MPRRILLVTARASLGLKMRTARRHRLWHVSNLCKTDKVMASRATLVAQVVVSWTRRHAGRPDPRGRRAESVRLGPVRLDCASLSRALTSTSPV